METVEWQLAALISPKKGSHEPKFALLMLNQPVKNVDLIRDLWQWCQLSSHLSNSPPSCPYLQYLTPRSPN